MALFTNTCIRPYGGGENRSNYQAFLKDVAKTMEHEVAKKEPSPGGPKALGKVYSARHLSRNGPASWAYAAFGFQDVMFVDVGAFLQDGRKSINRTLVINTMDGKWYVHPAPQTDSLISAGLNDETESTQDFSEAYEIQKKAGAQSGPENRGEPIRSETNQTSSAAGPRR